MFHSPRYAPCSRPWQWMISAALGLGFGADLLFTTTLTSVLRKSRSGLQRCVLFSLNIPAVYPWVTGFARQRLADWTVHAIRREHRLVHIVSINYV